MLRWPDNANRDQPLVDEPPLGAHLVSPRGLYTHHGIYAGGGRVVHYSGLSSGLRRGPVAEVSLESFARGRAVLIRESRRAFDADEVIRRARSRLGEDCYRLLSNNCQHFCAWALGNYRDMKEQP